MNDYFGVAPNKLEDNYVQFWTESDLNHMAPSDLFQFIDEHEDSINFWNFGVFMDYSRGSKTKIADLPASHHSKGTCLSFADGHATAKTWIDSRTVRKVEHLSWWLGSAPQPSPNNLDIEWLGRHTTIERQ